MAAGDTIHVDARELDHFAQSVDSETTARFQPAVQELFGFFAVGTTFGGFTASEEVLAARLKHHDALVSITQSMAGFVNASRIMADAVADIRTRYASADALAAADVNVIDGLLNGAVARAQSEVDAPYVGPVSEA